MKIMRGILSSLLLWGATSGTSQAFILITADVASGYSNCSLIDNGDGTSTASVDIKFNETTTENLGGKKFLSRGLLFYTYDAQGTAHNSFANYAVLGGTVTTERYAMSDYIMYKRPNASNWINTRSFTTKASLVFPTKVLQPWGAVTVRAGNYTSGDDVGEVTGGAYISLDEESSSCKVIVDPLHPPPPRVSIAVNAPDWDLGEIKRGEQSIPFSTTKDQLCLQYSDSVVDSKLFTITASSQNGEMNNQYRLINQDDATQIIPYQLALDSGTQQMTLPNSSGKTIPLEKGGKTCFVPTFTTFAPNSIKKGDYSDVLTFNIVTKS